MNAAAQRQELRLRDFDPQARDSSSYPLEVLGGHFEEGDHIIVDTDGETFSFRREAPVATAS
jgi:hypothetical protein